MVKTQREIRMICSGRAGIGCLLIASKLLLLASSAIASDLTQPATPELLNAADLSSTQNTVDSPVKKNSFTDSAQTFNQLTNPSQEQLPPASLDSYNSEADLYVLDIGDGLTLKFLDPTASGVGGSFVILKDGTANLALLGSVQLTGLTLGQATRWLTSLYSKNLLRPELSLSLTSPRPTKVTILGEVEKPGLYPLSGLASPYDAIQKAGGITLNADIRNVLLRRRLPGPEGGLKERILNLAEILQFGNQRQNPPLFDGDTLVIARTEEPIPDEVMQLSASTLTPASVRINVIGEVRSPGNVSVSANTPLDDVVLAAGGARNWTSNKRNVQVVRLNRNGTRTRETFVLDKNQGISNGLNPPLRNGDTVIVSKSFYGEVLQVLNELIFPLARTADRVVNTYYRYEDYDNRRR